MWFELIVNGLVVWISLCVASFQLFCPISWSDIIIPLVASTAKSTIHPAPKTWFLAYRDPGYIYRKVSISDILRDKSRLRHINVMNSTATIFIILSIPLEHTTTILPLAPFHNSVNDASTDWINISQDIFSSQGFAKFWFVYLRRYRAYVL